jgi:hypothetical protein
LNRNLRRRWCIAVVAAAKIYAYKGIDHLVWARVILPDADQPFAPVVNEDVSIPISLCG